MPMSTTAPHATEPEFDFSAPASPSTATRLRHRWWIVLAIFVVTTAGATYAALTQTRDYSASAQILVTPLDGEDAAFSGVQILRDSGDLARTVQTAVGLIDSDKAYRETAATFGPGWTERRLRSHIDVRAEGASNLVLVTGRDADPAVAARLATSFAKSGLTIRRRALADQLDTAIATSEARFTALRFPATRSAYASELQAAIDRLRTARAVRDPSLSLTAAAAVPVTRDGVSAGVLIAAGAGAGLLLGLVAALSTTSLDRRTPQRVV